MTQKCPVYLCIMDGVGLREETHGNAWKSAYTPTLDRLMATCPNSSIRTDGQYAGLPEGQMGNSEVGHMTMGSGRIILQNLERIRKDLHTGAFSALPAWKKCKQTALNARAIHLIGLISDGGVHSHTDHLVSLCEYLNKLGKDVFVHAITDGRDTGPFVADKQIDDFLQRTETLEHVRLVDVSGRFYAMDRDNRWERVEEAYRMFVNREGHQDVHDVYQAIDSAHNAGITDEFIKPSALPVEIGKDARIQDDDMLVFFNFRADRMRQIVRSFIDPDFNGFVRHKKPKVNVFTMTEYDSSYSDKVTIFYPPQVPTQTLGEIVSNAGLTQLRIAESEKYAHVTFFFNGGREEPFKGEERIVQPSPKVKTYDLKPQMHLPEVIAQLADYVKLHNPDLVIFNIANGDQVGHSGVFEAAVKAMDSVDKAIEKLVGLAAEHNAHLLITADHGNVEEMYTDDNGPATSHTTNPVPLIYVGDREIALKDGGLADIAPTCLHLLNLEQPEEMEGTCLISFS